MKTIKKLLVIAFIVIPLISGAQIKLSETSTLKTSPSNIKVVEGTQKVTLGKTDLNTVKNKKITSDLKNLKSLAFSPEELERRRTKSWEITPLNPFTSGLEMTLNGIIDKRAFGLRAVRVGSGSSINTMLFSMFLMINPMVGKDFKLTLEIEKPNEIPANAELVVDLGSQSWMLPVQKGQKTIHVLFTNETAGPHVLSLSPLIVNKDFNDPKPIYLTRIRLEELAPVQ